MEIELKYLINDEGKAEQIWKELQEWPGSIKESAEEKRMHAVYFDTADERLSKEKIAVRVRREGEELVATVKWGKNQGKALGAEEALHARAELNVPVREESWFSTPPADLFEGSEIGEEIAKLLGDEPLVPLLETNFTRKLIQIWREDPKGGEDMGCEAAVDLGVISAGNKTEPICELEMELLEGNSSLLMALGEEIKGRYGLMDGRKSKFARGKALRGEKL